MADDTLKNSKKDSMASSSGGSSKKNDTSRRPASSASFSMAHALSMVRNRKEQQTKVEGKSLEDVKKEKARAKRKRRRENQKTAKAKLRSRKDDEEGCTEECNDSDDKIEPTSPNSRENLKRGADEDEECDEGSSLTLPVKKRRKQKAKREDKASQPAYDDEAFKASLMKLKSMIPRVLLVKKKDTKS